MNFDESPKNNNENCEPYGSIDGQQLNLKVNQNEQMITNN